MTPTTPKPFSEAKADAAGPSAARIAALLPEQLLQSGETIVLLLKPSPWFIFLEAAGTLFAILLATGGAVLADRFAIVTVSSRDAVLIGAALAAMRLAWQFLEWLSHVYVLTDMRVIRIKGVLRITIFETPLKNVQHTQTHFTLRERIFSLGTISFATAGTGREEAAWRMLARPLEVHQVVLQTLSRYR